MVGVGVGVGVGQGPLERAELTRGEEKGRAAITVSIMMTDD